MRTIVSLKEDKKGPSNNNSPLLPIIFIFPSFEIARKAEINLGDKCKMNIPVYIYNAQVPSTGDITRNIIIIM